MSESNYGSKFRSSIEECYAAANQILEIQGEIDTKTNLWKAMGWNYFLKPVPGTTAEEAASEKAAIKKILITWLGIPAGCFLLGVLFLKVELDFSKMLGGLLVVAAVIALYADFIILPVKIRKIGILGRLGEQINVFYKRK
jgi:hypothetical protein